MSDIKYMNIKEFREKGFLQEANRLFFHPCGLALEVACKDCSGCLAIFGNIAPDCPVCHGDGADPEGEEYISGVWDYRDDPEGIYFGFTEDNDYTKESWQKHQNVTEEAKRHRDAREALFKTVYPGIRVEDPAIEPIIKPDGD